MFATPDHITATLAQAYVERYLDNSNTHHSPSLDLNPNHGSAIAVLNRMGAVP